MNSAQSNGWQSDVIADLIKGFGFPYITLNPGASYRGLHDSLVNHNHNEPPMLLCQHEKVAVQIAHGYAKACGEGDQSLKTLVARLYRLRARD